MRVRKPRPRLDAALAEPVDAALLWYAAKALAMLVAREDRTDTERELAATHVEQRARCDRAQAAGWDPASSDPYDDDRWLAHLERRAAELSAAMTVISLRTYLATLLRAQGHGATAHAIERAPVSDDEIPSLCRILLGVDHRRFFSLICAFRVRESTTFEPDLDALSPSLTDWFFACTSPEIRTGSVFDRQSWCQRCGYMHFECECPPATAMSAP